MPCYSDLLNLDADRLKFYIVRIDVDGYGVDQ